MKGIGRRDTKRYSTATHEDHLDATMRFVGQRGEARRSTYIPENELKRIALPAPACLA